MLTFGVELVMQHSSEPCMTQIVACGTVGNSVTPFMEFKAIRFFDKISKNDVFSRHKK